MSAIISECGNYRYRLERRVSEDGPTYAFFGVNPSTADASLDDATVRKWKGFVSRWGGSRFIVGNVFAYRATDVKMLAMVENPVGEENFAHMAEIAKDADILVPCWGNRTKVPQPLRWKFNDTLSFLKGFEKPLLSFGLSNAGDPKHPLMLGYDTELISL